MVLCITFIQLKLGFYRLSSVLSLFLVFVEVFALALWSLSTGKLLGTVTSCSKFHVEVTGSVSFSVTMSGLC